MATLPEGRKTVWQKKGNQCCVCQQGPIFVKHHCRKCGRVVHTYDDCSAEIVISDLELQQTLCLNPDGSDEHKINLGLPVRICNLCRSQLSKEKLNIAARRNTRTCCQCSKKVGAVKHHCRLCGKRVHKSKCSVKAVLENANEQDLVLNPNGSDDPTKPLRFCFACLRKLQAKTAVSDISTEPLSPPRPPSALMAQPKTLPRRIKTSSSALEPPKPRHARAKSMGQVPTRISDLNDIFEPLPGRENVPKSIIKTHRRNSHSIRSRSPSYRDKYTTKGGHKRAVSWNIARAQTDIAALKLEKKSEEEDGDRENSASKSWGSDEEDESVSKTAEPEDNEVDDSAPPEGWMKRKTADGYPYYQHIETKEVSWIYPRSSSPRIVRVASKNKSMRKGHSRSQSMPAFLTKVMSSIKENDEERHSNGVTYV